MSGKLISKKLVQVGEEAQLIAEEKWILDTLKKIKNQRNSLEIERLQLESLKAELFCNPRTSAESKKPSREDEPSTSTIHLMQSSKMDVMPKRAKGNSGEIMNPFEHQNFDIQCNTEELNLQVTTPIFHLPNFDAPIEEDESEDDDDNVLIDINMLMNGMRDEMME